MHVDRVVVSLSDQRGKLPMDQLLDVRLRSGCCSITWPRVYEESTGKIALEKPASELLGSRRLPQVRDPDVTKRVFDVTARWRNVGTICRCRSRSSRRSWSARIAARPDLYHHSASA